MNNTQRALTSLIAIFGLLAFTCLSWVMQPIENVASELQTASNTHQIYCAGPASGTVYLAEVKPRFSSLGLDAVPYVLADAFYQPEQPVFAAQDFAVDKFSRPLWLVNRALLI